MSTTTTTNAPLLLLLKSLSLSLLFQNLEETHWNSSVRASRNASISDSALCVCVCVCVLLMQIVSEGILFPRMHACSLVSLLPHGGCYRDPWNFKPWVYDDVMDWASSPVFQICCKCCSSRRSASVFLHYYYVGNFPWSWPASPSSSTSSWLWVAAFVVPYLLLPHETLLQPCSNYYN
jgi:hypothetical protein